MSLLANSGRRMLNTKKCSAGAGPLKYRWRPALAPALCGP